MDVSTQKKQDDRFWKILDAVLYLEVQKGHLLWKVSDIARVTKVTRSLIYYYFGKSKQEIVQVALKVVGEEFFGLSPNRLDLWKKGNFSQSVLETRKQIEKAPHVFVFYLNWRNRESELKKQLVQLENRYLSKLMESFKGITIEEARALFAIFLGLVSTPLIQEQDIEVACTAISTVLKPK